MKNWGSVAMKMALKNLHRSCRSKKSFPSAELAMQTAAKFNQRVYECNKCGEWHLTKILGGPNDPR